MNSLKFPSSACLALVGAGLASGTLAQGPVLTEHDYFEELPVVLSVSRLAQPVAEAPGAVTVIDREMIRQSGARHPVDLLRLVPGFQVAQAPNMAPMAVYHGLGDNYPQHMQVLIDGRSQYSPFFVGGVNWSLLPVSLEDIDRVEIVRGSNSAAYGSNAFLGVVNIITRHAADTPTAGAELRSGTQGINDKRIRLGITGDRLSMRVTAETRRDKGLSGFDDRQEHTLVNYRADWRLGLRDEMEFQAGRIATTLRTGSPSVSNPYRDQEQGQQFIQLGWRRNLGENEDVAVRYYRAEEKAADAFVFNFYDTFAPSAVPDLKRIGVPNFVVPIDYGFTSVRQNIEASHTFLPWRDTRLVWGAELRTDSVSSEMFYGRPDSVSLDLARLFGNLEWRPAPAWIANIGATWEHDSNSKTTFAPRLALNWHVAPGQTLRAGIARAYRTPSLFEQRGAWTISSSTGVVLDRLHVKSGSLVPESMTSRELGWVGEFRPLRLTADVRVFHEKVVDRAVLIPMNLQPPQCEYITMTLLRMCGYANDAFNAQDIRIRGLEYQVRWQPLDTTSVLVNQSFIRLGVDFRAPASGMWRDFQPDKDAFQVANSAPTHATTVMLMQKLPGGLEFSAAYSSVGAMKWTRNTYAKAWHRLDWRLGYPFRLGSTRGELAYTVRSDGTPHAEHAAIELVSRRSFITLRLDY